MALVTASGGQGGATRRPGSGERNGSSQTTIFLGASSRIVKFTSTDSRAACSKQSTSSPMYSPPALTLALLPATVQLLSAPAVDRYTPPPVPSVASVTRLSAEV